MPFALVETKFFVPPARDDLVARPRLHDVLGGRRTRLTLVSAPAGFGKTTLLSRWLATPDPPSSDRRCAWVSLDEGDREASTFWAYVLTALERVAPGAGAPGLTLLGAGQPIEPVLVATLNELSVLPVEVDLVLDDYHLAESLEVQPGVAFLLDHLPPQTRLVIITRADPALSLARLRARGDLTEVRAADLRFDVAETTEFLAGSTGLALEPADVEALGARTEGWIASLQLAAISLRGRDDPSQFIAGFAGDDRYVVDYLVEEVLDREPDDVRDFLLRTAVLDRLCGPLCDSVTGTADGSQMLESLVRRNLFVTPLDDQRRWYRYHHLFADVLRTHLTEERPGEIAVLHRRASGWYADNDLPEEAVRHALAAGDVDRAALLVERAIPDLRRERRESVIRQWVEELPAEALDDRPVLALGLIGGLMASNDFGSVGQRLAALEVTVARPAEELIVDDEAELARLPAAIETYRAGLALVAGDPAGTIVHAERAMATAADGDDLTQSAAAGLAGLASWATGDIASAHRSYQACAAGLTRSEHIADVLGCSLTLADMELAMGRLGAAERTLDHALDLAGSYGPEPPAVMRGSADMLVGLSRAAWHRNDLAKAADLLDKADSLGETAGLPQHPYRWRVALARLRVADGDFATAVELLDEAERVYVGDFSPQVHPIHATRTRVLLAGGDVAGAVSWARRHQLGAGDELTYLREYEHLTLARVLLAGHRLGGAEDSATEAAGLLDRLLVAAEAGGRSGTVMEVEVLRARAYDAVGDRRVALAALGRAVELAEPDGWVRLFVDSGPETAALLAVLDAGRSNAAFVRDLLAATSAAPGPADPAAAGRPESRRSSDEAVLVDPLSERELDVLRLLGSDLDGPGIARELVVSLNTVRTHTKHIYTKLGVNNRRSAITMAHRLGLLSSGGRR